LVGYIFFNRSKAPFGEGPKKIIAERLHFDAQQMADYDKLIAVHRTEIRTQDSLIRQTKNGLYGCLNSNNIVLKDSLENKLGQLQTGVEAVNYNHFLDLKKLCRDDQLSYFNDLVKDLAQLFGRPNPRPKR